MALLAWNHACTVGVRAMDDQHGVLMDAMNELHMAWVRGSGRGEVMELLHRLIELTRMHFRTEEQLMEQTGFPGLAAHCDKHQRLLRLFEDSAHRAQEGEEVPMHALLCGMRDEYLAHIEGPDREYGPWMNQQGLD